MSKEESYVDFEEVDITELSDHELDDLFGGAFAEGASPVVLGINC